jgi:hypothetical protein
MPIDFPSSPTTGQVYTYLGKSWVYNGTGWDSPRALSEIGAVQTFANAAARTAAIPTPTEGIVTYLNDVDLITIYESGAWRTSLSPRGGVLQVVQATTTTPVFTTSTSYVTGGLQASITPKSSANKILIQVSGDYDTGGAGRVGNITIFKGGAGGSNLLSANGFTKLTSSAGSMDTSFSGTFLDSPATASSTTYTVMFKTSGAGMQIFGSFGSITLLEIAN